MPPTDMDLYALTHRIEKLESQNHRWKLATFLLALFLASSATMAMTLQKKSRPELLQAKAIEARTFLLRDSSGHIRAQLRMKGEKPLLEFYNQLGNVTWTVPGPKMMRAR
jgi:hypothetical protein